MEYEQSGLTRGVFCSQHDISPAMLDNYRRHCACGPGAANSAASATTSATASAFIPVELVEYSSFHKQTVRSGASLHVELFGGRRISVSSGFDAGTLTRLLAVLEQA
jgi:hypothetical protein